MPTIEASNLSKSYDSGRVKALQGVSFSINKGEVIGLLGPNGAGKTTLMKMLTGYIQPDEGNALIAGCNIVESPLSAQEHIGYLPENAPLYHEMAVQEYLKMMADLRRIPAEKQRNMLSEAIYATGLEKYLTRRIGNLSKGYKQRVGIAQAILHKPDVLILDEPTTGLDPTQIVEIRDLIRRLSENSTVLLSTHILSEVEMSCDRALVIIGGELKADAPIKELNASQKAVILAVDSSEKKVKEFLLKIEGVASVNELEMSGSYQYWRIRGEADDLAPRIYQAVRGTNWKISELRPDKQSLESVFHQLAGTTQNKELAQ